MYKIWSYIFSTESDWRTAFCYLQMSTDDVFFLSKNTHLCIYIYYICMYFYTRKRREKKYIEYCVYACRSEAHYMTIVPQCVLLCYDVRFFFFIYRRNAGIHCWGSNVTKVIIYSIIYATGMFYNFSR